MQIKHVNCSYASNLNDTTRRLLYTIGFSETNKPMHGSHSDSQILYRQDSVRVAFRRIILTNHYKCIEGQHYGQSSKYVFKVLIGTQGMIKTP